MNEDDVVVGDARAAYHRNLCRRAPRGRAPGCVRRRRRTDLAGCRQADHHSASKRCPSDHPDDPPRTTPPPPAPPPVPSAAAWREARNAVDEGDYIKASDIASTGQITKRQTRSIFRRIANRIARGALSALRAGHRDEAQKLLWKAADYPVTTLLRKARREFEVAEKTAPRSKRIFRVAEVAIIDVAPSSRGEVVSCPVDVRFVGRISVVGGAGTVSYRWQTSNGLTPERTLRFEGPGSRTVATTERFSGAPGTRFNKEQLIMITNVTPLPHKPWTDSGIAEAHFICA